MRMVGKPGTDGTFSIFRQWKIGEVSSVPSFSAPFSDEALLKLLLPALNEKKNLQALRSHHPDKPSG
jgi:hypothetical protein